MSRIFHRPMFRTGGSAGGITSGMRRGFAFGGSEHESNFPGPETYHKGMPTEIEESTPSGNDQGFTWRDAVSGWDDIEPPQSQAGPNFLMNLGLNLMGGPSTGSFWGNVGEAGKEPFQQLQKERYADKTAKYKHQLAKKQFMLDAYTKLNSDEKIAIEKEIEFWMSDKGGNKSRDEALEIVMFRKPGHPKDVARQDKIRQEESDVAELQNLIKGLGDRWTTLDLEDAKRIKAAKDLARDQNLGFDLDASIIIDRRLWKAMDFGDAVDEDGNIGIHKDDWKTMSKTFQDGYVYVDIVSGNIYKKDGPKLIKIN